MTYGVYSKDLVYQYRFETTLKDAQEYCRNYRQRHNDAVICSEKEHTSSYELRLWFHGYRGFHKIRWERKVVLGFVSFEWVKHTYKWADKVVEDTTEKSDVA